MSFDWIRFFRQHSIEFVESGPNVAKGNVNIHCPFCGTTDPSHHMGISLSGAGWGCWRDSQHRGKSPKRLVMALINCSASAAADIVGSDKSVMPVDSMAQVCSRLTFASTPFAAERTRQLKLLPEFKKFRDVTSFRPYLKYLLRRGFSDHDIFRMSDRYHLRYCTTGAFGGRIIFLVHDEVSNLVSWTGRSVSKDAFIRYKSLPYKDEVAKSQGVPLALGPISDYLLWHDDLLSSHAETILLVEGPFDALKVRVLGEAHGVMATCFFTQLPSTRQVDLFHGVLPRFKRKLLVLDRGTTSITMRLVSQLRALNVQPLYLPESVKDPGDLNEAEFLRLLADNF